MFNQELIDEVMNFLKSKHPIYNAELFKKFNEYNPKIFSNSQFQAIENFYSSVNWNALNDAEFEYNLRCLIALLKDAHTNVRYGDSLVYLSHLNGTKCYKNQFVFKSNKVYLHCYSSYFEVLEINGCKIKNILKSILPILNFETKERKNYLMQLRLNEVRTFEMLQFEHANTLNVKINKNGVKTNVKVDSVPIETLNINPYSYKIKDDVLYLKSQACGTRDFSFEDVLNEIKKEYQNKPFNYFIYDIRNNRGGNNAVVQGFHDFIKENKLKGVAIVNNGTFSAGIWEAVMMKEEGFEIIGEEVGQPVCRFGNSSQSLKTDNFTLRCSTTFFEQDENGEYYKNKPYIKNNKLILDLYVENTIEDLINNKDSQLQTAYDYINNLKLGSTIKP